MIKLDEICEVDKESFNQSWSKETFDKFNSDNFSKIFLSHKDNKIVGFIVVLMLVEVMEIVRIAVKEKFRKNGFGKQLLQNLIDYSNTNGFEKIILEVRENNHPAINLYKSFGFKVISKRKAYYLDTKEDALVMLKNDLKNFNSINSP